jgi:prepilin signal peptidase PulO-like enzyme (type II secretory pathway)
MDQAVVIGALALVGAAWGFAADRLAARWPSHEDGSIRPVDWRTPLVVLVGAVAAPLVVERYATLPTALLVLGIYVAALVVLLATDLDQRLLPDVITLPLIGLAAIVLVSGSSIFIRTNDDVLWAVGASIVVPAGLYALSIPFGRGAIGQGDLKLLVSVGLLTGSTNLVYALIGGALLAGIVVGALLFVRRISLKTYVPYGPFLIAGILWVILGLPQT